MTITKINRWTCDLCKTSKLGDMSNRNWAVIEIPDPVFLNEVVQRVICKECAHKIEKFRALNKTIEHISPTRR